MPITREALLSTFPEDSDGITEISDEELANINKFLSGDIESYAASRGSTIVIKTNTSSHTLDTTSHSNAGSGYTLYSSAKGYRSTSIPEFAPGTSYSVTLSGTTISLYVSGTYYTYISDDGTVASSSASGTFT